MKKILLSAMFAIGSLNGFAAALPTSTGTVVVQDGFTEIKADELPEAVKNAFVKSYPDARLDRAFVNKEKEYKLEISVKDQKATVYMDADGNQLKK